MKGPKLSKFKSSHINKVSQKKKSKRSKNHKKTFRKHRNKKLTKKNNYKGGKSVTFKVTVDVDKENSVVDLLSAAGVNIKSEKESSDVPKEKPIHKKPLVKSKNNDSSKLSSLPDSATVRAPPAPPVRAPPAPPVRAPPPAPPVRAPPPVRSPAPAPPTVRAPVLQDDWITSAKKQATDQDLQKQKIIH